MSKKPEAKPIKDGKEITSTKRPYAPITTRMTAWNTPEKLKVLESLRSSGCTMLEIAAHVGVASPSVLYVWMQKDEGINAALSLGKEVQINILHDTLFQQSFDRTITREVAVKVAKKMGKTATSPGGMVEVVEIHEIKETIPGNVHAAMFLLRNISNGRYRNSDREDERATELKIEKLQLECKKILAELDGKIGNTDPEFTKTFKDFTTGLLEVFGSPGKDREIKDE